MSTPSGMLGRQTPWKPSQPAITSHSSSCLAPSWVNASRGRVGLQVRHRDVADLEQQRPAAFQPRLDQILDHLGLPVDDDRLAGQLVEGDPVTLAVELELDPVMDDPLALHPPAHAGLRQQVGGPLLEHARANARLDVVSAAVLDHDRIDPLAVEQVGERQPGRPRADDPDLRAPHAAPSSSRAPAARSRTPSSPPGPRVHGRMEEHLLDLVGGQAVAERGADVHRQLVVAAERDQRSQRDAAAGPPVETRPRPDLAPRVLRDQLLEVGGEGGRRTRSARSTWASPSTSRRTFIPRS